MKLIWHGHSCFTLETSQGTVVFDPYEDGSVPGLPPLHPQADLVLCSHEHHDHNARGSVALSGKSPSFTVERLDTFHDPEGGTLRGPNTIHMISADGLRVAHMGDLGCALTPEQLEKLRGLDAVLLPVGGYYTIDAAQANETARQLQARVVVPMHYRGAGFGYDVIAPLENFLALREDVIHYPGPSLTLEPDMPVQTAVLDRFD